MRNVHRRTFIFGGIAAASAAALPSASAATRSAARRPAVIGPTVITLPHDPFQIGVASGDPTPDGFVLWTRLAPAPLNPDGLGGMPGTDVQVEWQVATDTGFGAPVATGTTTTTAASAHSVHVEVGGLAPGREYFYRFRTLTSPTYISPVGRAVTAPAAGVVPGQLKFAMASCAHFEEAWFHGYRAIANDRPDLVLFLGDYIYEFSTPKDTNVRKYVDYGRNGDFVDTLAEYRVRYAQHRTDPALRAAHAAAPWLVVFDDHEIDNDWNVTTPPPGQKVQAFQAWYENMPVRATQRPDGRGGINLYRRVNWGGLARFHMLDTRQYRSPQAANACNDTTRQMISLSQEQWLIDGLATREATWDFIGQQIFFANKDGDRDRTTCDGSADAWDGYRPQRDRIAAGLVQRAVPNPVMLTGDVHRHWAADLLANPYNRDSSHIGVELVATSISSGGPRAAAPDPNHQDPDNPPPDPPLPSNLPYVKYLRDRRGYVRCTLTQAQLTAEFMEISRTVEPDFSKITVSVGPGGRFIVPQGEKRLLRG